MSIALMLEKIKPFIAISILLFLAMAVVGMNKEIKLNKEIKENCGYQRNESVYCICDKNLVSQVPIINNPYYSGYELKDNEWD